MIGCCAVLLARPAGAQTVTRAESIRGRVTTDSGTVIAGADVIATMAPDREVFRTTTDSSGRYDLEIAHGTGDYFVYVGAPGRRGIGRRITRAGSDSVFTVDVTLVAAVTQLAAMRTTLARPRPPREDDAAAQVGGDNPLVAGVAGQLLPDQMGVLDAMAATVPGIAITPDGGISAFGLDPSQNRTMLNGTSFDGGALPRDLPMRVHVATSAYDPSLGGFGGALISADIAPGGIFTLRNGHVTLDAPELQSVDATGRALGQRFTRGAFSIHQQGELVPDRWVYDAAVQGSRQSSVAPSLASASDAALERLGVAPDSAARLLGLLARTGIPAALGGAGGEFVQNGFNAAFRADRARAYQTGGILQADTQTRLGVIGAANYSGSSPMLASALAAPSHDGESSTGQVTLQGNFSKYFGAEASYLDEARTAVSYNVQRTTPLLAAPTGAVLVSSALADGTSDLRSLQFGGAGIGGDDRSWRWEANNAFSFNLANAVAHRITLFTRAELDGYRQTSSANTDGTFTYNSLADLERNAPASFTRVLSAPVDDGGEASGAFAIGDYWTKSPEWQFVFGPRVEWNVFTRRPTANPAIAQLFGASNDVAPSEVHVSPRFGFTWLYPGVRKAGRASGGGVVSDIGAEYVPPKGVLRGGVGEFRGLPSPTLLAPALVGTGLPDATTTRLTCVGSAVPIPDWSSYLTSRTAVPSTCADGTGAAAFTDAAPSVQLFDPSYDAMRRWTSNLTWASMSHSVYYTVDGSYSLVLDQPGTVDLNFTGAPRFTLADEASRPVFVDPSSIVPSTGLVSPLAARRSAAFGRVVSERSDLRSATGQATLAVQPLLTQELGGLILGGWYTYTHSRSLTRGFDGTTFGDPAVREWARGFTPTHQVRVQLGYRVWKWHLGLSTFWNLQSGFPYTPVVGGDVNGDGLANDRAFVFDPARAPTPAVAAGMQSLLASTTREARDCLARQLGEPAAPNSCSRPWDLLMTARVDWSRGFGDAYHNARVGVAFSNPLAGIDRLLHGSNLRGWGVPDAPDPTLYYVRGFDPASREFLYEVNQRFGNTRPSIGALYNPFRVTIDVSFSLNGNVQKQQVNYYLRPLRSAPGKRPPADSILARIRSSGASPPDYYYWTLANADSLLLTAEQVIKLQGAQRRYHAAMDSSWHALAADLAALPADYDPAAAIKRIQAANVVFQWGARELAVIRSILTPVQGKLLPFR